jgi:hypothetical protein
MDNLSDFIAKSIAEKDGDKWTVYVDRENRRGAINQCIGETEYEAKEDAWRYFQKLKTQLNK